MSEKRTWRMYVAKEISPGIFATVEKIPEIWLDFTQEQMIEEIQLHKEYYPEQFSNGTHTIIVDVNGETAKKIRRP